MKEETINNFKQGIAVFLIDLVVLTVSYVAIALYAQMTGALALARYVLYGILIVYTIMHFYLYPLMMGYSLSLKDLYKNALLFVFSKLPKNLMVLLLLLVIHGWIPFALVWYGGNYGTLFLGLYFVLEFVIMHAFTLFLSVFALYPGIKRDMQLAAQRTQETKTPDEAESEEGTE